jgi:predicted DNA-binding transcriptional regulator AlpA
MSKIDRPFLDTGAAAAHLGIGRSTLEKMRIKGTGPRYYRLGPKMVRYAVEDLDAWRRADGHISTSEYTRVA